jgi:hypothetical protein
VGIWYLLTTLPRGWFGSCFDGNCSFSIVAIIISIGLPLLAIAFTVAAEMFLYRRTLPQAVDALGISRVNAGSLWLTGLILVPLLAFYPVFSLISGNSIGLAENWGWVLITNGAS